MKILCSRHHDPDGSRYKRFRSEIQTYRSLSGAQGILPLHSCELPEEPSHDNPPWIATRLAQLIRKALGKKSGLEEAVEAVAVIADTLVYLHDRNYSHRDLKPENLFRCDEHWVIGDFGLADFPGKEAVTAKGEKLGPTHYIAPEMIAAAGADHADGRRADVYSLAKTLWVLATGQKFPPPGELRCVSRGLTIGGYVVHDRTAELDQLIEQATRHDPNNRIMMAEVTARLGAWLAGGVG